MPTTTKASARSTSGRRRSNERVWREVPLPFASPTEELAAFGRLAELAPRIADKVTIDPQTGCWIWEGTRNGGGYGEVRWNGPMAAAHRVVRHLLVGDVDPSPGYGPALVLDHVCRCRACVSPFHLTVITNRENCVVGARGLLGQHSSPYFGVTRDNSRNRWFAQIRVRGHKFNLGRFSEEHDAASAYDAAAQLLHGDPTNYRLGLLAAPPSDEAIAAARARIDRTLLRGSHTDSGVS